MTERPELVCTGLNPKVRSGGGVSCLLEISRDKVVLMTREFTLTREKDFTKACDLLIEFGMNPAQSEKMINAVITESRSALENAKDQPADLIVESQYRSRSIQIIEAMSDRGRWLMSPPDYMYFNGTTMTPIAIDSLEMDVLLNQRFKINETERISNYAKAEMKYHTARQGEEVVIHDFSFFDQRRHCIYMYLGDGKVLKLDGNDREVVPNGEDNILFRPSIWFSSWEYQEKREYSLEELAQTFSFEEGGDSPFRPEEQQLLFIVFLLSLFLKSVQPTKPLVLATGSPGSGKTSMLRALGQIIVGPEFEVDSLDAEREEYFWTAITNSSLVVYDNVDSKVKWLENALAKVATGGRITKRKSHTTNQMVSFKVDCFLGLTSFAPRFRRPDVAERLLIFWMSRRDAGQRRPERWLQNLIAENRSGFLSEVADHLNSVLGTRQPADDVSDLRMADFASVAKWIGAGMSRNDEASSVEYQISEIIEKIRSSQQQFAGEENPLILALKEWVLGSKDGQPNYLRTVPASILNDELDGICTNVLRLRWPWKTNTLTKGLKTNASVLDADFEFETGIRAVKGNGIRVRLKTQSDAHAENERIRSL